MYYRSIDADSIGGIALMPLDINGWPDRDNVIVIPSNNIKVMR